MKAIRILDTKDFGQWNLKAPNVQRKSVSNSREQTKEGQDQKWMLMLYKTADTGKPVEETKERAELNPNETFQSYALRLSCS